MSSTFGILNNAYSGLAAARAALDVTGQNIANVGTDGYTRQRVEQVSVPGTQTPALFSKGAQVGAGVAVLGVGRLNDTFVDARVRDTASTSGYWDAASSAVSSVDTSLNEPGPSGLSSTMNDFWAGWQNMANSAGTTTAPGQAAVLIGQGQQLASQISAGYTAAKNAWTDQRTATATAVTSINSAAVQVATLNKAILQTTTAGGNANEMMDQRDSALAILAKLAGSTTRQNTDGTVDVYVGGSTLVAETSARSLTMAGTTDMTAAAGDPVRIEWTDTHSTATIAGGSVAAQLATLAGPSGGAGGIYAETAQVYNDVATKLAAKVNTALTAGYVPGAPTGSTPGSVFFSIGPGPAASTLKVVVASAADIAINSAAGNDGSVADQISLPSTDPATNPDGAWATFVSNIGVQSKNAATQSTIAASASTAAKTAQTSQSGVDLDEETTNLITYQHAYQAAARVMTTIDSVLDTLINRTGLTT